MRVLKLIGAGLIAVVALLALASGFVVLVAVAAVVVLALSLRRLFTGKPTGSIKFEVHRSRPVTAARKFDGTEAIDVEATPVAPSAKTLEN